MSQEKGLVLSYGIMALMYVTGKGPCVKSWDNGTDVCHRKRALC